MQPAVRQAIAMMHDRYFEPLTLNDLASEVFVSPFHFSRVFARATGVTPGRYLTAVRMFEAKRLLLTSSLTVSDIVCSVGYSSVGTFTSRFTRLVGITPTSYRAPEVGELLVAVAPRFQRLPSLAALREAGKRCGIQATGAGVIAGRVQLPAGIPPANVLIGVFGESLPQCAPVAFTGMSQTGSADFTITGVPAGRWHLIAVAEHGDGASPASYLLGTAGYPLTITSDERVRVTVGMRGLRHTDPPIAITLAAQPGRAMAARAASQVRHLSAVA
ncbi:MAG TPA: AraC family transcriptional regulator [Pilimelia sp.]|nr:AraC family transcriptional regulator [Pilimelia sp.]